MFNKLVGTDVSPMSTPVGADLSRPSPIYRPPLLARESSKTQLRVRHVPFHEYTLSEAPATIDVAILNLLYQPSNAWMIYGLQVAVYALKPGGRLYVVGAKDRGVLSIAKRMQSLFGNLETLVISKRCNAVARPAFTRSREQQCLKNHTMSHGYLCTQLLTRFYYCLYLCRGQIG